MAALVWQTIGDDLTCDECTALHGHVNGDGWCSALAEHQEVWIRNPTTGHWRHVTADDMPSGPPLHGNCRCGTYLDQTATAYQVSTTNPNSTEQLSLDLLDFRQHLLLTTEEFLQRVKRTAAELNRRYL